MDSTNGDEETDVDPSPKTCQAVDSADLDVELDIKALEDIHEAEPGSAKSFRRG